MKEEGEGNGGNTKNGFLKVTKFAKLLTAIIWVHK